MDELLWALSLAHRGIRATVQRSLRERGIHAGQHFVLEALWAEDNLTSGELARRLGVALPTVTKAVSRMETAGVVVRRPDPDDARVVHVRLTPYGRQLEQEIQQRLEDVVVRAMHGIATEDRQRTVATLFRIRQNLHPDLDQVHPLRASLGEAFTEADAEP